MKKADNLLLYREADAHLLADARPSLYFESLDAAAFAPDALFEPLELLRRTEQSPVWHPEGNVWNHTMLVVDEAAERRDESGDPRAFLWAALLHDIGKPAATKRRGEKIVSYGHDRLGAALAEAFFRPFDESPRFIARVTDLVRFHMQPLFAQKAPSRRELLSMMERVPAKEVALLGLCDRLGRRNADRAAEEKQNADFLRLCESIKKEGAPTGRPS